MRTAHAILKRFGPLWLIVVVLLILHAGLGLSAARRMSTTCDEVAHLTAGYSYCVTGDYRLVPEHPPLAEVWAALPLTDVSFPSLDQQSWWTSNQWEVGAEFLYQLGNDTEFMLLRGRCMIALLSVGLGLTVFLWARRLFGPAGGLVSLVLYCLSPTMIAHGSLITTDMAAALFFILSIAGLWSVLHRVTPLRLLGSVLAITALVLAKMSALLIIPVAGGMVLVRLISRAPLVVGLKRTVEVHSRLRRGCVIAVVAVLHIFIIMVIVWGAYGFRYAAMRESVAGRDRFTTYGPVSPYESSWDFELRRLGGSGDVLEWARDHRVLPESFLYGLAYTLNSTSARQAFLNGERATRGFRTFFPYSFLVKTPLPLFGVLALAMAGFLATHSDKKLKNRERQLPARDDPEGSGSQHTSPRRWAWQAGLYETTPLWILFGVYWASAIASHINIGHRHLLPTYPILFILAGAAALLWQQRRHALVRWSVPAMLGMYALASVSIWPHYLAYFNSLVGGPRNGYRHLVDSSLDWGQSLKGLAQWLDQRDPTGFTTDGVPLHDTVYLACVGNESPAYHGIDAKILLAFPYLEDTELFPLGAGVYCISATALQQVYVLPSTRWTNALERAYQTCISRIRRINDDTAPGGEPRATSDKCHLDDELVVRLRFGRLCAALRRRVPDDQVGYAILIYHLTDEQIREAFFGPPPELAQDTPETLRDFAGKVAAAGDIQLALEFYREVLQLAGHDVETRVLLGNVLYHLDQFAEAREHYREAIRLDPGSARAFSGLGLCLAAEGENGEAVDSYQQALRLDPRDADTRSNLGMALAALGRTDEAIEQCRRALRLKPRDPALQTDLARAFSGAGQLDRATDTLTAMLARHPRRADGHAVLASVLAKQGNIDRAVVHYHEAIRLTPDMLLTRAGLAALLLDVDQAAAATREYELLFALDPPSSLPPWWADAMLRYGLALQATGKHDEADVRFREAARLDPAVLETLEARGIVVDLGDPAGQPLVSPAADMFDPIALAKRADRLVELGRHGEAVELYNDALVLQPDNVTIHLHLAEALFEVDRPREALVHYLRAAELGPQYADIHNGMGRTYVDLNEPESAVRCYQEAIRLKPDLLAAHYNLGTVLAHLGRYEEAIEAMERALKLVESSGRADLAVRIRDRISKFREQESR